MNGYSYANQKESALLAFLGEFDAYVEARARLRAAEDGTEDCQRCIYDCAEKWNRVMTARASLPTATGDRE